MTAEGRRLGARQLTDAIMSSTKQANEAMVALSREQNETLQKALSEVHCSCFYRTCLHEWHCSWQAELNGDCLSDVASVFQFAGQMAAPAMVKLHMETGMSLQAAMAAVKPQPQPGLASLVPPAPQQRSGTRAQSPQEISEAGRGSHTSYIDMLRGLD